MSIKFSIDAWSFTVDLHMHILSRVSKKIDSETQICMQVAYWACDSRK